MSFCGGFRLCEKMKFKLTFSFCARKNEEIQYEEEEESIILLNAHHKNYTSFVPNTNYLFLKILSNEKIIAVSGDLLEFFDLKTEDLLYKKINYIIKRQDLFIDCIEPLFCSCLKQKLTYQFDFEFKNRKFSCSIYPCLVLKKLLSVDIVIRNSQNIIINHAVLTEQDFL
jgi:hypothetical protein